MIRRQGGRLSSAAFAAAALALGVAAPASARPRVSCAAGGATILENASVRVFRDGKLDYACRRPGGPALPLDLARAKAFPAHTGTAPAGIQLAGVYVAYEQGNAKHGGEQVVSVLNLATRRIRVAASADIRRGQSIAGYELNVDGTVVSIANSGSCSSVCALRGTILESPASGRTVTLGSDAVEVARARPQYPIDDLALAGYRGTTAYWSDQGVSHAARIA